MALLRRTCAWSKKTQARRETIFYPSAIWDLHSAITPIGHSKKPTLEPTQSFYQGYSAPQPFPALLIRMRLFTRRVFPSLYPKPSSFGSHLAGSQWVCSVLMLATVFNSFSVRWNLKDPFQFQHPLAMLIFTPCPENEPMASPSFRDRFDLIQERVSGTNSLWINAGNALISWKPVWVPNPFGVYFRDEIPLSTVQSVFEFIKNDAIKIRSTPIFYRIIYVVQVTAFAFQLW